MDIKDINEERTLGKSLIHQAHTIKETNKVDDIKGARSKSTMNIRRLGPYEGPVNPITGAIKTLASPSKPVLNHDVDKTRYDYLDYKDVNDFKRFKAHRQTNPLSPTYLISEQRHSDWQGSKPQQYKFPPRKEGELSKLSNHDIHGSQAGFARLGNFHSRTRRAPLKTNDLRDIEGAQANTLKSYIDTVRNISPLMPDYQFPGRSEL